MFTKLKNKIQIELEKERTSTNASICSSSVSSSRIDLTSDEAKQTFEALSAVFKSIEESEKNEQIYNQSQQNNVSPNDQDQLINLDDQSKIDETGVNISENANLITENHLLQPINFIENAKEIEQLKENNNKLIRNVSMLKTNLVNYDSLKKDHSKLLNELESLKNLNKELLMKNEQLRMTNFDSEGRNTKLLNKMDELKEKTKQIMEKNNVLLDKNKKINEKNEELLKTVENLEKNINKKNKELMEINLKLTETNSNSNLSLNKNQNQELDELKNKISKLEEIISEKNKTIRLQNQRINDIKKSVQKGDLFIKDEKSNNGDSLSDVNDNGYSSNDISPKFSQKHEKKNDQSINKLNNNKDYATHVNDINFKYLQNVVFKFITSNDYESQKQLVKAISTLLKFTNEEEEAVKQSLYAKGTWFRL